MGELVAVARLAEIPPGSSKIVAFDGKSVAIFNVGGTLYAIVNACVHRGGPVGEGELDGTVITCPWHGWSYDITTGASEAPPGAKLAIYRVEVDGAEVKLEHP